MAKYQFVGTVNPTDRFERVQYAKGKFLELNGEPQALSDAQVTQVSKHAQLRRIEEGDAIAADFGPDPEDNQGDPPKPAPKPAGKG